MDTRIYARYLRFIESRRHRRIEGIVEVHHIVPRAHGGTDDKENLIELSPREHFIAHWMLWRAYRDQSMTCAFWAMNNMSKCRIHSRTYQTLREEWVSNQSKRMRGNKHTLGKKMPPRTPEHIENNRQAQLRRKVKSHPQQVEAVKVSNAKRWEDPTFRSNTTTKMRENNAKNVSVVAAGTRYRSIAEAVRALNTTAKMLRRKLRHPDYKDYYIV